MTEIQATSAQVLHQKMQGVCILVLMIPHLLRLQQHHHWPRWIQQIPQQHLRHLANAMMAAQNSGHQVHAEYKKANELVFNVVWWDQSTQNLPHATGAISL